MVPWKTRLHHKISARFQNQKSTIDPLIRVETHIREANIRKEHLIAEFFDLEKAYDTTWKYGIMKDLHKLELWGSHLISWTTFYLKETLKSDEDWHFLISKSKKKDAPR